MTQAAIANVEAQPSHRSQPLIVNLPMIRGCAVISIMMVMTGTATTPLTTAVQYRALISGQRPEKSVFAEQLICHHGRAAAV
jgi:hypothetical protein